MKETTPTNSDPGVEDDENEDAAKNTVVDNTAVKNKLLNMISLPQVLAAKGKKSIVSRNYWLENA